MGNQDNIKIFIGSGEASLLERKTLIYSLHKHSKRNLDIYVYNGTHNAIEHNQEEPVLAPLSLRLKYRNPTTEFGLYRYLVPQICQYRGKAIYLDSDIVCLTDIGELWDWDLNGFDFLALANAAPENRQISL
jgi:lipopolysaccharide biosynthesis glycosyltransferase